MSDKDCNYYNLNNNLHLSDDIDFVMMCLERGDQNIDKISERLRSNKKVGLKIIENNTYHIIKLCNELRDDKEIVLSAIKYSGFPLRFASDRLKNDKEVVLKAVQVNNALSFASDELKDNKEIVLCAIQVSPYELLHASERLKNDWEILETFFDKYSESHEKILFIKRSNLKNNNQFYDFYIERKEIFEKLREERWMKNSLFECHKKNRALKF